MERIRENRDRIRGIRYIGRQDRRFGFKDASRPVVKIYENRNGENLKKITRKSVMKLICM
jgi:hypothetical protein